MVSQGIQSDTIVTKVLDLLKKTKEALVADLENEFVSVRQAALELRLSADATASNSLAAYYDEVQKSFDLIDAVFAKVGYDISHYDQLSELKGNINKLIDETAALGESIRKAVRNYHDDNSLDGDEVAALLDEGVPRIQNILTLVKDISNTEWSRVEAELNQSAADVGTKVKNQFFSKDFARAILDHILVTLLKNAKVIFKDEIDYVKLTLTNEVEELTGSTKDLASQIEQRLTKELKAASVAAEDLQQTLHLLLKETLDEANRLEARVSQELKQSLQQAKQDFNNVYAKVAHALSVTHAILDFLGILKEKEITLKLPKKLKAIVSDLQGKIDAGKDGFADAVTSLNSKIEASRETLASGVAYVNTTIDNGLSEASQLLANKTNMLAGELSGSMKITQEMTGMSVAAVGAVNVQMLTMDMYTDQIAKDTKKALSYLSNGLQTYTNNANDVVASVAKLANERLETLKNFEYPIKIEIIDWKSLKKLFTQPVEHFKALYPINTVEDAEDLMRRIMGILHNINPDIPDFSSLRSLLEDLLRQLQQRMMQLMSEAKAKGREVVQEIWNHFQPLITTIRKVIDMLKEFALALKDQMFDVLNDVKGEVKSVVKTVNEELAELQRQFKEEANQLKKKGDQAITQTYKNLSEVYNAIDENASQIVKQVKQAATSAGQAADDMAQATAAATEEWRVKLPKLPKLAKLNLPRLSRNALTEPLISAVEDAWEETEGINVRIDLSSIIQLSKDIEQVKTSFKAINKDYYEALRLISKSHIAGFSMPKIDISKKDLTKGLFDTSSIDTLIPKGIQIPDIAAIVEEAALPELKAWAYGVVSSIKTVTNVDVWRKRMDTVVAQLQAEFQSDMSNITGLISKEGALQVINHAGAVKAQLASELSITDYITIVRTAVDDVVLPNPEYYFTTFKRCILNILSALTKKLMACLKNLKSQLKEAKNAFEKSISNFQEQVLKQLTLKINDFEKQITDIKDVADRKKEAAKAKALQYCNDIKALKGSIESTLNDIKRISGELQDLFDKHEIANAITAFGTNLAENIVKNLAEKLLERLDDLAHEVWGNVKSQIINPLIDTLKNNILEVVKRIVTDHLKELVDKITDLSRDANSNISKLLDKLPTLHDLVSAERQFISEVTAIIKRNNQLQSKVEKILKETKGNITNLNQLPKLFKELAGDPAFASSLKDLKLHIRIGTELVTRELQAQAVKEAAQYAEHVKKELDKLPTIQIPYYYITWLQCIICDVLEYVQSDRRQANVLTLVKNLYDDIPEEVKDKVSDILPQLPTLPKGGFSSLTDNIRCSYDLDNKFCNVTLLDLKPDGKDNDKGKVDVDYRLLLQLFLFVGTYGPDAEEGFDDAEDESDSDRTDVVTTGDDAEKEEEGRPALYLIVRLQGHLDLTFKLGDNHTLDIELDGAIGEGVEQTDKKTGNGKEVSKLNEKHIGFCLTRKDPDKGDLSVFHGLGSTKGLGGRAILHFQRKDKDAAGNANPLKVLNTTYLDINIGNYPQTAYVLYNYSYPENVAKALGLKNGKDSVAGFTAGYLGSINDMEFVLKLRNNSFFGILIKDDISAKFSLSLLYDYLKGFKIGGGYSFHYDIDCSGLKLGSLTMQSLSIDIGSLDMDWGTLHLGTGSSFSLDFSAIAFSFENLGLGFNLNILKPDFSMGDWDFGVNFKFPDGIGIAIDTTGVKGAGLISYTPSTGVLFGVLDLEIIDKFGVSALLLADLGIVEGHYFSLVAMISARFSPGIPLSMGFTLTGIGGSIGLQRMIDRTAIQDAVYAGTLGSVFFVENLSEHMAEMISTCESIFPSKQKQFFLGLLAQISYEPVLSCSFGVFLQLPDPTMIMIVGMLKVSISDTDIIRINVCFAGGIDFSQGIWFDAAIVDSEIVGIKLEGSMAFRLYWGGSAKGFLLSIGGFHPAYKPEEAMNVSQMKRVAMKLDYKVLKVSLETYLAITSNTFQIGARLDIRIGWKKFGITGYAGFDALFQFDPFMFMFDIEAGMAVKCGSWTLMSIDVKLSLSGPQPWRASGSAKFKFIFIPIKVSFDIEWGRKRQELPKKQIEVLPLFEEELTKIQNWSAETGSRDKEVNLLQSASQSEEMVIDPSGTLSFNQSAIPLNLDRPMDLCNNAVPTDVNNIVIKGFSVGSCQYEAKEEQLEVNDFAPALYFAMDNKDKLKSPSYVSYHSGVTMGGLDKRKTDMKSAKEINPPTYELVTGTFRSTASSDTTSRSSKRNVYNVKATANNSVAYQRTDKESFERYVERLDSIY